MPTAKCVTQIRIQCTGIDNSLMRLFLKSDFRFVLLCLNIGKNRCSIFGRAWSFCGLCTIFFMSLYSVLSNRYQFQLKKYRKSFFFQYCDELSNEIVFRYQIIHLLLTKEWLVS